MGKPGQRAEPLTPGEPPHALHHLTSVPISAPYIAVMREVLTAHGAQLVETGDFPNDDPAEAYQEFSIGFPPGTTRTFGLLMMRSRHFAIHFPDGFELRGGDLWPLHRAEGDRGRTVLYLPQEAEGSGHFCENGQPD